MNSLIKIKNRKKRIRMKEWIKELRSGEYKQGESALRIEDKYCCLGVACDIYAKSHVQGKWVSAYDMPDLHIDNHWAFFVNNKEYSESDLTPRVLNWLGLEESVPAPYIPRDLFEQLPTSNRDRIVRLKQGITRDADNKELYRLGAIEMNDDFDFSFKQIADCFEFTYLHDKSLPYTSPSLSDA